MCQIWLPWPGKNLGWIAARKTEYRNFDGKNNKKTIRPQLAFEAQTSEWDNYCRFMHHFQKLRSSNEFTDFENEWCLRSCNWKSPTGAAQSPNYSKSHHERLLWVMIFEECHQNWKINMSSESKEEHIITSQDSVIIAKEKENADFRNFQSSSKNGRIPGFFIKTWR